MTEDVCAAPTTGDQPCQNPTSDTGERADRCWIPTHNDPEAENPHGRDFSLSEADHDDILDAAESGLSKSGCARAAGVSHTELNRYLEAHPDFRSAFAQARETGEQTLVERGLYDPETDSSMAKFLLSTSFGYIKTEKKEVDMDADVDHTGDVTAEFVTYDGDE